MLVLEIVFLTYFILNGLIETALSSNPSIIIVGGGSSGIAAATKLLKNNFTNIKILEAENRIGGRIRSVHFGDAYVDVGAEFCDGEEGNIIYSMVGDLGILRHSSKPNFLLSNGDLINKEIGEKIIEFAQSSGASNNIKPECENVTSVGECFIIKLKNLPAAVEEPKEKQILTESSPDWVKSYLSYVKSTFDLNDLNILSDYKTCKGTLGLNWNGLGFKTILERMMQKYPNKENQLPIDDKILLQKEVTSITNWQNGEKLVVSTSDGSTYTADHVIVTPSVGVLKATYETLFNPSLPQEKINAIKNIGFGATMKVIMHFPARWWKKDSNLALLWTTEDKQKLKEKNLEWLISVLSISQGDNNPNVMITLYAGRYIPLMETLSDEEILEGQKHLINTFLAPLFNVTMPDKIIRSSWYSNSHFLGAYSHESVKGHSTGGSKFPKKLASPLLNQHNNPTVLFAGEATHPYYFSTVHGAIETGYREANRLINLYRNSSLQELL